MDTVVREMCHLFQKSFDLQEKFLIQLTFLTFITSWFKMMACYFILPSAPIPRFSTETKGITFCYLCQHGVRNNNVSNQEKENFT